MSLKTYDISIYELVFRLVTVIVFSLISSIWLFWYSLLEIRYFIDMHFVLKDCKRGLAVVISYEASPMIPMRVPRILQVTSSRPIPSQCVCPSSMQLLSPMRFYFCSFISQFCELSVLMNVLATYVFPRRYVVYPPVCTCITNM